MALAGTGLHTAMWPEGKEKFPVPIPLRKTKKRFANFGVEHALVPGAVTVASIVQCGDWLGRGLWRFSVMMSCLLEVGEGVLGRHSQSLLKVERRNLPQPWYTKTGIDTVWHLLCVFFHSLLKLRWICIFGCYFLTYQYKVSIVCVTSS